jgi:PilZ domain
MDDSERDRAFHDGQRAELRASPRVKVKVPVELYVPNSDVPLRGATSDLSETGCYIESIFPFPVGTPLEMSLALNETVLALGTAVTCDPQVGNGIKFTKMLPDDREQLRAYLEAAAQAEDEP